MASVPDNYASPWARWGVLVHDHPGATHDFTVKTGDELGIPAQFGGGKDKHFCVCTINLPDGTQHVGWKAPDKDAGDSNEWVKVQAKALGRACKRAGYPDNMADLKAVMHWRQRSAEVAAISIQAGSPVAPAGELEMAPASSDDAPSQTEPDDDRYVGPDTGEITEAEIVPDTIDPKTIALSDLAAIATETVLDGYEAAAQRAGVPDPYAPTSRAQETLLRKFLAQALEGAAA